MSLDKLSLDEMVQGRNKNTSDWKVLIKEPEREQVWNEAVKRRDRLDRFCYLAAKWPQFVGYYQQAKRFVKHSSSSPIVSMLSDTNPIGELAFTLNTQEEKQEPLLVNVEWGSQQLIEIQGDKIVSFDSESQVQIHYRYETLEGWITSDQSWDFSQDEGAVMLTIIDGNVKESDLFESLNKAKSVCYMVLLPSVK